MEKKGSAVLLQSHLTVDIIKCYQLHILIEKKRCERRAAEGLRHRNVELCLAKRIVKR